jgi:hypothetical protein
MATSMAVRSSGRRDRDTDRPHRASALALHALEAMGAFQIWLTRRRVKLETTVERPTMMTPGLPTGGMD